MKPFRSPRVGSVLIAVLLLAPALTAGSPLPSGVPHAASPAGVTFAAAMAACDRAPEAVESDFCRLMRLSTVEWLAEQSGCAGLAPTTLPATGVGLSHLVASLGAARVEATGVAAARLGIPFGVFATADAAFGAARDATDLEHSLASWTRVAVVHASARDLVASLPVPTGVDASNPPTRDTVLAFAALTAPSAAPDPAWFAGPAGLEWAALASERLAALTQEIADAEAEYPTDENGWPTDEALAATARMREDRMLLAIAALYLAFHDANYDGNLLGVLTALGSVALLAGFDAAVLLHSGCDFAAVTLADDVTAIVQSLLHTLLPFSPRAEPGILQMLADVLDGAWYNTVAPAGMQAARDAEGVVGPAYEILEEQLGAAMRTESLALYHGAFISTLTFTENMARSLPRDATAVTDGAALTAWSVAIGGFEGSAEVAPAFHTRVAPIRVEDAGAALAVALGTPGAPVDEGAAEAFLMLIGEVAGPHRLGGEPPFAIDSPLVESLIEAVRENVRLLELDVEPGTEIVNPPTRDDLTEIIDRIRRAIDAPDLPDRDDVNRIVGSLTGTVDQYVDNLPDREELRGAVNSLVDRLNDHAENVEGDVGNARDEILRAFRYDDNLRLSLVEVPSVYEENGRIYQITNQSYEVLVKDEREPDIIYDPGPQSPVGCWFNKASAWVALGGLGAGAAGWALGATPAGAPLIIAGFALEGASIVMLMATDDACDGTYVYDPGWYRESGVFTNHYGHFGWVGDANQILGGLVTVYGTTIQPVLVPTPKPYPYSNVNADTGYYHGVESARQERETWQEIANVGLEEFHGNTSPVGSAFLTIDILCSGFDLLHLDANWNTPLLDERGSFICLRVVIGGDAVGTLKGEGYGDITHASEGIDGTGWVEVNGERVPSPAVLDAEGAGKNCPGGSCP